jgi:hypothetical protein
MDLGIALLSKGTRTLFDNALHLGKILMPTLIKRFKAIADWNPAEH